VRNTDGDVDLGSGHVGVTLFSATNRRCMDAGSFAQGETLTYRARTGAAATGIAIAVIAKPYLPWGDRSRSPIA